MAWASRSGRKKLRQALRKRDGDNCHYCGEPMIFPETAWRGSSLATIEHLTPRAKGGTDDMDNLVLAHLRCNQDRNAELMLAERVG